MSYVNVSNFIVLFVIRATKRKIILKRNVPTFWYIIYSFDSVRMPNFQK